MAPVFPGIYISCPCSDQVPPLSLSARAPRDYDPDEEEETDPLDPRNPRSSFSLFPLEHLLYCEDCHQVRCPRCVQEEIVSYFCPSCLFEVPHSTVKTEGNRCTRNCFQCPICFASVTVTSSAEPSSTSLAPSGDRVPQPLGPYTLTCHYCHWSSREIGLEFEKPSNLTAQLAKQLKAAAGEKNKPKYAQFSTQDELFSKLKAHYSSQGIGASGSGLSASRGDDYGPSPGTLSRLMGLYTGGLAKRNISGLGTRGRDMSGKKTELTEMEGVEEIGDEREIIERLMSVEFDETTTLAQNLRQPHNPRFISQLRPIATLLRTKRSKRCRSCRHILVRPEPKVQSIRYRIKLVAMNYIPAINISRLDSTIVYNSLTPFATHQFLLTVTNPLFDPISVTLATPQKTPGKYPCIVTILCPEFEVGANADAWDEVLKEDDKARRSGRRERAGSVASGGTVWDSGRNWTMVVIEVIPPSTEGRSGNAGRFGPAGGFMGSPGTSPARNSPFGTPTMSPMPWGLGSKGSTTSLADEEEDERDEDEEKIVQVPIFVRVVYEAEVGPEDGGEAIGIEGKKEKKEHAYWWVLYLGRIGTGGPAAGLNTPVTPGPGSTTVVGMGLRDAGGVSGSLGRVGLSKSSTGLGRERG
ncbi:dynactin p62 family-domain-containing protein [Kalaharituber pfeilii]|nr:dynactin p62 family-domain-containing protein [Kalaharituber pfeilii]